MCPLFVNQSIVLKILGKRRGGQNRRNIHEYLRRGEKKKRRNDNATGASKDGIRDDHEGGDRLEFAIHTARSRIL